MRSKSSGRSFDLRRDRDCRAKDDLLRLGIRGGRESIVQRSRVVNTKSRGACVSVSMAKEATGAAVPRGGSEKRKAWHFVQFIVSCLANSGEWCRGKINVQRVL
jgi:hypothetical protein